MFNYAQLNEQGYCVGISSLSSEISHVDMILIEVQDPSYINRKYDRLGCQWRNEYLEVKPRIDEHKVLTRAINSATTQTSSDVLGSMELELDTNSRVALSQQDGLMLMEILLAIQGQLNSITPPTQV